MHDAGSIAWTPPSWDEIVREHSTRVYRLAFRLTGNPHDAEDLTQEVFVRVFRSLSSYTPGTFEGWLHRITTNLFLDQARRKQRIRMDAMGEDGDRYAATGAGPVADQVQKNMQDVTLNVETKAKEMFTLATNFMQELNDKWQPGARSEAPAAEKPRPEKINIDVE